MSVHHCTDCGGPCSERGRKCRSCGTRSQWDRRGRSQYDKPCSDCGQLFRVKKAEGPRRKRCPSCIAARRAEREAKRRDIPCSHCGKLNSVEGFHAALHANHYCNLLRRGLIQSWPEKKSFASTVARQSPRATPICEPHGPFVLAVATLHK